MSFRDRLIYTLVIERTTPSAEDTYGQPGATWAPLVTVPGLIEPKSFREMALVSQQGAVVADYTIFLEPRDDITAKDRVRLVPDDGRLFEVMAVRPLLRHHLELDARAVV